MRKFYSFVICTVLCAPGFAQALFNNKGADIYVTNGGFVIVKTNSLQNDQISGAGQINNQGTIIVEGSITNNANIVGSGDTIKLTGDWAFTQHNPLKTTINSTSPRDFLIFIVLQTYR